MKPIFYIDRQSQQVLQEKTPGDAMLRWLYSHQIGKLTLHGLMKRKFISVLVGCYMNSRFSKGQIESFIKEHDIDMSVYQSPQSGEYASFNQFFYRKIKPEFRPIDEGCVSPADGKVLAFQNLSDIKKIFIKGSEFSLSRFLQGEELAQKYVNGSMLIVRLAPNDYHRFHFPADGNISQAIPVNGWYFSVSPLALQQSLKIFLENRRVISSLATADYGDIQIVEVGATMVGSIVQTYSPHTMVRKGEEKGYFAFGGSTLVLLFEEDTIHFNEDLLDNTAKGYETMVRMGEKIGIPS